MVLSVHTEILARRRKDHVIFPIVRRETKRENEAESVCCGEASVPAPTEAPAQIILQGNPVKANGIEVQNPLIFHTFDCPIAVARTRNCRKVGVQRHLYQQGILKILKKQSLLNTPPDAAKLLLQQDIVIISAL